MHPVPGILVACSPEVQVMHDCMVQGIGGCPVLHHPLFPVYADPNRQLHNTVASNCKACGAAVHRCDQTCHMCADRALCCTCSRATLPSPTTPSLQRTAQWPTTVRSAAERGAGQTRAARTSSPTSASCLVSCLVAASAWLQVLGTHRRGDARHMCRMFHVCLPGCCANQQQLGGGF
jgi:hypothetical protein